MSINGRTPTMTSTTTTADRTVRTDTVFLRRRQDLARFVRYNPPDASAPAEVALAIRDQRRRLDGYFMYAVA
jgi:hypothetical protein